MNKQGSTSKKIMDMPYVDYNDGYTFVVDDVQAVGDKNYMAMTVFFFDPDEGNLTSDLKVLGSALKCTASIVVPGEVVTNDDAPLLIGFNVPSKEGTDQLVFKVR